MLRTTNPNRQVQWTHFRSDTNELFSLRFPYNRVALSGRAGGQQMVLSSSYVKLHDDRWRPKRSLRQTQSKVEKQAQGLTIKTVHLVKPSDGNIYKHTKARTHTSAETIVLVFLAGCD